MNSDTIARALVPSYAGNSKAEKESKLKINLKGQ
jgi:hypothetical protein